MALPFLSAKHPFWNPAPLGAMQLAWRNGSAVEFVAEARTTYCTFKPGVRNL